MSPKAIVITAVVVVVVGVAAVLVFLKVSESMEREAAYSDLIEEGFMYLSDKDNQANLDTAIKDALDAQNIFPGRKDAMMILGRAYNAKGNHRKAEEIFKKGLEDIKDVDYYTEFSYYLGYTYSLLYNQLKKEELLNKAVSAFTEGTLSGYHRADSYFGIGALYFDLYLQNTTPYLKDKVLDNFQRCVEIESHMEGYVPDEPDSVCPLCRQSFTRKSDQPKFSKLMKELTRSDR